MAITTIADRICRARQMHQESIRFASDFWDPSDLLSCLTQLVERIYSNEVGTGGPDLEIAISLRRLVTEKCLARWGVEEEEIFRELSESLYYLHSELHAVLGTVTWDVRAAALLLQQKIEACATAR